MHHFQYKKIQNEDVLHAEDVSLVALAEQVGTPFYCYSKATLTRHYQVFDSAFETIPHIVCFSTKANSNVAILNLFAQRGSGFDIVSGGELKKALKIKDLYYEQPTRKYAKTYLKVRTFIPVSTHFHT